MDLKQKSSPVSVVIPAFNAAKTIEACLRAVAAQSISPLEILVVDDGSTDSTATLAAPFARVIPNNGPPGPGAARNAGARAAQGEILAFIDSDCIAWPEWLENIAQAFEDPAVGAVGGGYSGGVTRSFWQEFCFLELAFRRRDRAGEVETLVSNNMACRRDVFWEAGGFPQEFPVGEDMLLSYRISRRHKVLWLPDNGVVHHFKNSLGGFLAHQFFFGAESVRLLLSNPQLLASRTHQPRSLYGAALAALGMVGSAVAALVLGVGHEGQAARVAGLMGAGFFLWHLALYRPFLLFLRGAGFRAWGTAYGVSWLRDVVVGFSVLEGGRRAACRHRLAGDRRDGA